MKGRVSRPVFWLAYLLVVFLATPVLLASARYESNNPFLIPLLLAIYGWIAICLGVKRLHDIDWSGWLAITLFLMPVSCVLFGAFRGTPGPNRFGPEPL